MDNEAGSLFSFAKFGTKFDVQLGHGVGSNVQLFMNWTTTLNNNVDFVRLGFIDILNNQLNKWGTSLAEFFIY